MNTRAPFNRPVFMISLQPCKFILEFRSERNVGHSRELFHVPPRDLCAAPDDAIDRHAHRLNELMALVGYSYP